jgi:hypothetical protein
MYGEAVRVLHALGDRSKEAWGTDNLGHLALEEGDLRKARELFTRSLDIHRGIGDVRGMASSRGGLAQIRFFEADVAAGRKELESVIATLEGVGDKPMAAQHRLVLARFLIDSGEIANGEAAVRQAVADLESRGGDALLARTIQAAAAVAQGRARDALATMKGLAAPLEQCEDQSIRLYARMVEANALAAQEPREAVRRLEALMEEADQRGLEPLALELRIVLGALEPDRAVGRARLAAAQRDAQAAGLVWLSRKAAEALARTPRVRTP